MTSRLRENSCVAQQAMDTLCAPADREGTRGMLKKAVQRIPQQARRRRVPLWYVESPSDASTKLAVFFSILLDNEIELSRRCRRVGRIVGLRLSGGLIRSSRPWPLLSQLLQNLRDQG